MANGIFVGLSTVDVVYGVDEIETVTKLLALMHLRPLRRNWGERLVQTLLFQWLMPSIPSDSSAVLVQYESGAGLAGRCAIVQRRNPPGMFFVKFVVQFIDLHSGLVQSLLAGSRDLIDPATVPSNIFEDRLQETAAFQAMQKGVESSRPDAIPVMRQFLHHRKAEDGLLRRMYEYMNPYQPEKEFSLVTGHQSNIPPFDLNRISIV